MTEVSPGTLRLCLDVNVLVSDALSNGGVNARIVDIVRSGTCALGEVQLIVSWRMLTTFRIVLQSRFRLTEDLAATASDLIAAIASAGPHGTSPYLLLGGTGVIPMNDDEDAGVAETALATECDMLITNNLDDFEGGQRSRLNTRRLLSKRNGGPAALMIEAPGRKPLLVAIPSVAIGWLSGQTAPPPIQGTTPTQLY